MFLIPTSAARPAAPWISACIAACAAALLLPAHAETFPTPVEFVGPSVGDAEGVPDAPSKLTKGSAAERHSRNKLLGASYTKKYDLGGLPAYAPREKASGKLRIWGNNYIYNSGLAQAWADGFKKYHPGLEVELILPSAAIATPSLYMGAADVAMTHEPTFYDSLVHLRVLGYEPVGFKAVTGAYDIGGWMNTMVVAVHKDNPISEISMEQLDGVFGSVREGGWEGAKWHPEYARGADKDIRTWGQLGVGGALASQRITPYGYAVIYSTAQEFSRKVLQSSGKWNGDLHDFGNAIRPDGSTYLQADQISDHLLKDPAGIAYIRYSSKFPKDLKILKLKRGNGPAIPFTLDTVHDRSYPLAGDMSFFTSVKPGEKMKAKSREFIAYVLSREGQAAVQDVDRKYLPLTAEVVKAERARLDKY